jgi:peptidoglycan/xylan/chitin deacetylase (PgdA/CDA1 family)
MMIPLVDGPGARLRQLAARYAKRTLASAFVQTGLLDGMGLVRRTLFGARLHVLAYHRVVDGMPGQGALRLVNPALCVSVDTLRRQLEQARARFDVVSLTEGLERLKRPTRSARDPLVLTFDDGYADVALRAAPLVAELGLCATVFVPTGYIGSGRPLLHDQLYAGLLLAAERTRQLRLSGLPPLLRRRALRAIDESRAEGPGPALDALLGDLPDQPLRALAAQLEAECGPWQLDDGARVLSAGELRLLADQGWDIGAHTVDHVILTHEERTRVLEELVRPREELERLTGRPCRLFAYCNGRWSPEIVDAVREAGYVGAVTTCDRPNSPGHTDPLLVGRKTLWEAHAAPSGRFSPSLSAAALHDLFGDLHLTRPLSGQEPEPHPATGS